MGKMILLMRKSWIEGKHPRSNNGQFTLAPDTGISPPIGNSSKHLSGLKDNIHTILQGTKEEKKKLEQMFFYIADTPQFMKELGLSGDYFSVKYGVISRHTRKDKDHNLSEQNWIDLCDAITEPFSITTHGEGYRLFTSVKIGGKFIAVGVDVKNIGKGIEINSVSTAFGYTERLQSTEKIIYKAKNMTPEQTALLEGLNSPSYPSGQGPASTVSPQSLKKSSHRLVIKRADSIAYLKDDRGSPARMDKEGVPHAKSSHTPTVSPKSLKKSSPKLMIKRKPSRFIRRRIEAGR